MVGCKKTLPTLQGMVLSLNVTNKTVRDNCYVRKKNKNKGDGGQQKDATHPTRNGTFIKCYQQNG
ncbi:MAG: hypothetical protein DRR16_13580 [Candidatus Parabeggiatoa sp. nov. 3]|nr:MAG: hypothetical protein DRR16_13580 [Gammaproteobacteria bacterium]